MTSKSHIVSRRHFLKTATATAAATGLPLWFIERELDEAHAAEEPKSANDKPGIALVGCGGQGRGDTGNARRFGNVVCVCDVDDSGAIVATDALLTLKSAVGQQIDLICPAG